eukprot:1837003-Karenia_brevis.AAC.1
MEVAQRYVAQQFHFYNLSHVYSWRAEEASEAFEMSWAITSEALRDIVIFLRPLGRRALDLHANYFPNAIVLKISSQ